MAIYARLENGTYAEVTGVYKTDGTEVSEIFQGDRLVYSATNEIYGTVPLYYDGLGYDLTDYLISGNTVQDGTPSADAPVEVQGSGVRTGNLFDINTTPTKYSQSTTVTVDGRTLTVTGTWYIYYEIDVVPNTDYYVTWIIDYAEIEGRGTIAILTTSGRVIHQQESNPFSFNSGENQRIRFTIYSGSGTSATVILSNIMLNLGSTALPYEPYGFKLPPTVNGTEYPIYLGECETTRRIKKLVLTGEETVRKDSRIGRSARYYIAISGIERDTTNLLSSHFTYSPWYEPGTMKGYVNTVYFSMESSQYPEIADFKTYLAAQYQNGTPVTVWYVLAEPETAVVNEPLMKIGDYADTVSFAQSQVAIPTVNGANVLDMTSPVKPSEMYIKGKGIKPTGYGQLADVNGVNILDKDGRPIYVHGQ